MGSVKLISVADTPAARDEGLMFVRSFPDDAGMLFKWQSPRVLSFWMKNTYVPLDIAFIDHDGIVVKTERMIPFSTRSVSSGRPCVMALEVLDGTLAKIGAEAGKKAEIDLENMMVGFQ
jgi:uncharacterized membrane protein (UPF0127 family)